MHIIHRPYFFFRLFILFNCIMDAIKYTNYDYDIKVSRGAQAKYFAIALCVSGLSWQMTVLPISLAEISRLAANPSVCHFQTNGGDKFTSKSSDRRLFRIAQIEQKQNKQYDGSPTEKKWTTKWNHSCICVTRISARVGIFFSCSYFESAGFYSFD